MHFASVLQRLGIAEAVDAKAKYGYGTPVAEFLISGEAEIAVQQVSELKLVDGIHIVPLPDDVQSVTTFSAAIVAGTKQAESARKLIDEFASQKAAAIMTASGLEPLRPAD